MIISGDKLILMRQRDGPVEKLEALGGSVITIYRPQLVGNLAHVQL